MLPSWCRDTVTVVRPTMRDSRGTQVADWTSASRHSVSGCSVQISTTSSDRDGRQQAELLATLYLPEGADVRRGDRIEWVDNAGETHEFVVDGMCMPWRSPTGRLSHVQAHLTEWRG